MEHPEIEKYLIVDRYLLNQLTAQQAEAFEQHYLSCPECLDQLELSEKLIGGMKRTSAEQIASLYPSESHFWPILRRHSTAVWTIAALIAFALPSGLVYRGLDRLSNELKVAQTHLQQTTQQEALVLQEAPTPFVSPAPLSTGEQTLQLERQRQERLGLESEVSMTLRPQANTPVLKLAQSRSLAREASYRIQLGERPEWWLFIIEPPGDQQARYRASLLREDQKVWQEDPWIPNTDGILSLSLHSSWLQPGIYHLRLEELVWRGEVATQKAWTPAGSYSFSVLAASENP